MKTALGYLYPESEAEIEVVFESRKNRDSHPQGKFDKGGRWYPSDAEIASCCDRVRSPSRAHPYSCLVHCRTRKHIQTWYAEHATCARCGARLDALERVGAGRTCNACLSAATPDASGVNLGEGIGLGVGFGVWVGPQFFDRPTIAQLKAARAECVMFALAMHRRILRAHPQEIVIEWEGARRYWIQQAYRIHGEICMMIARVTPITAYYGGRGEMHTDLDY